MRTAWLWRRLDFGEGRSERDAGPALRRGEVVSLREAAGAAEAGGAGRPPYDPLLMLKALLLQQWYGLSDADLEEAINDRMSFRQFLGLSLEDAVAGSHDACAGSATGWSRKGCRRSCLPSSSGNWRSAVCSSSAAR